MQIQLQKYCDKCFISLTNHLLEVRTQCSVESVHKLRLVIKKLYTLLGMLSNLEKKVILKKEQKIIDLIYRKTGRLRDIHVQIDLLKNYKNRMDIEVDSFVLRLISKSKKYKEIAKLYINRINQFDLILLNQRIDDAIHSLSKPSIDIILHEKPTELFTKMNQIIRNHPDEKELHRIRIILKELIYTLSIIKKEKYKPIIDQSTFKYLKSLQQAIGDWHDLKVLYETVVRIKGDFNQLKKAIELDKKTKFLAVMLKLKKIEEICLFS